VVQPPGAASGPPAAESGWMEHNGLWLNIDTRVVRLRGSELELTRSEFDLLAALLQSNRRVRTKPDLALLLRGESYVTTYLVSEADKRAIEVHMGNLRKKLAENVNAPRWIETVRGVGYRLTAPDSE
jgi:two-component system OmpR family response regulator